LEITIGSVLSDAAFVVSLVSFDDLGFFAGLTTSGLGAGVTTFSGVSSTDAREPRWTGVVAPFFTALEASSVCMAFDSCVDTGMMFGGTGVSCALSVRIASAMDDGETIDSCNTQLERLSLLHD
jgi:hypothetical protein